MLRRNAAWLCASTLCQTKQNLEDRITKLGDEVVRPVDYFGIFSKSTYTTPMVILLGNHSSGKSTFINSLVGQSEQETGLAPTDDGFTVIMRGDANVDEQGPTALANPANGFSELQEFGTNFQNHFRLKIRKLPENAKLPKGMMIVDTPGMIDTPPDKITGGQGGADAYSMEAQARGYDFLRVTKWFAQRADSILLMFDPNNPGTTGETLMVLTNSLVGHEHKFKIVLNKSDMFKNVSDYARAYGTLAWNLSKVIQVSKDIPPIFSSYTKTAALGEAGGEAGVKEYTGAVPEAEMARARKELTKVVLSAPLYRLDNLMTEMEESARRVVVAATVVRKVQINFAKKKWFNTAAIGASVICFPALMAAVVIPSGHIMGIALGIFVGAGGMGGSSVYFSRDIAQYERKLLNNLDDVYEECFPGNPTIEESQRWLAVKKLIKHRSAKQGMAGLPSVGVWSGDKVSKMLKYEVPQLRKEIRAYKEEAALEHERCMD